MVRILIRLDLTKTISFLDGHYILIYDALWNEACPGATQLEYV